MVLDGTDTPLGTPDVIDPDTALMQAVEELLERQINPSVAAHGGHIGVEKVEDGKVYLLMSGGCQGCAASSATLRDGVERMLRAALPAIRDIVDVTDHSEGDNPFYARDGGATPSFNRPVPPGVIAWEGEEIVVDPEYLAPRLGLTSDTLRAGMRSGDVVGVTETGQGADAGKTRIVLRSPTRAWAAEVFTDGTAREIPPPRTIEAAAGKQSELAAQVRAHLESLTGAEGKVTYGALARALGHWAPGSVGRITRALEVTMHEDASANRPFIAARAVSRGPEAISAKGFFELARTLGRGPETGETDAAFHAREIAKLP
jgi:Fe-S cluster biogenesis protein NfuA